MGVTTENKYKEDNLSSYCFVCCRAAEDGFICNECSTNEPVLEVIDHTISNPESPLGNGLRTLQTVAKNGSIGRYVGDYASSKKHLRSILIAPPPHYVVFCGTGYLDASGKTYTEGNIPSTWILRYANHSCEPNCQLIELKVKNEYRIYLRALRNIRAYEEVTYDYDAQRLSNRYAFIKCECGTKSCRGFINRN